MADNKYYDYYKRAYTAVLGGMVGEYEKEAPDKEHEGQKIIVKKYGLKAYCPIAEGFGYSHYDDFGDSRSYGYRRRHLGNDLLGAIGTPIVMRICARATLIRRASSSAPRSKRGR